MLLSKQHASQQLPVMPCFFEVALPAQPLEIGPGQGPVGTSSNQMPGEARHKASLWSSSVPGLPACTQGGRAHGIAKIRLVGSGRPIRHHAWRIAKPASDSPVGSWVGCTNDTGRCTCEQGRMKGFPCGPGRRLCACAGHATQDHDTAASRPHRPGTAETPAHAWCVLGNRASSFMVRLPG